MTEPPTDETVDITVDETIRLHRTDLLAALAEIESQSDGKDDTKRRPTVGLVLGFGSRCPHSRLDGRCDLIWNQFIIVATLLLAISIVPPAGNTFSQMVATGYLLIVPGMALTTWARDPESSLFSADNLMLIVPLSFLAAVVGSLPMGYLLGWAPEALATATAIGSAISARVRISEHIRHPDKWVTS